MVVVQEWVPAQASDAEIESVVAALNEVFDVDLPGDPPWLPTRMREYLSETMPGERRICWLAGSGSSIRPAPDGFANLLVLGDVGVLEVLVRPEARSHGLGHALVAAAARRAYTEGVSSIGVEAVADTPAIRFWEALGFRCAYVETRSVLDLASVDQQKLKAVAGTPPPDYRIEFHAHTLPKPLLQPYAVAKASRQEPDTPGLHPSSYDAQRLLASLDTLNRRGMTPYLVLAVHEPTGAVAALTEVVVPAQHPNRADQYDTIVMPAHHGLGLERVIKARMLRELQAVEPQLTEVQTWNAPENDPMAGVNAELGYRPDRQWREYEVDVTDLIHQLNP